MSFGKLFFNIYRLKALYNQLLRQYKRKDGFGPKLTKKMTTKDDQIHVF